MAEAAPGHSHLCFDHQPIHLRRRTGRRQPAMPLAGHSTCLAPATSIEFRILDLQDKVDLVDTTFPAT